MGGRYIVPLDLGSSIVDKCSFYLRRFIGERSEAIFWPNILEAREKRSWLIRVLRIREIFQVSSLIQTRASKT